MNIRNTALTGLIEHLVTVTGSRGYRGLRFLHELNDFPCFHVHAKTENRTHAGAGMKLCIIECDVRGYVHSDTTEAKEDYLRRLEIGIQEYSDINREIEECRVIDVRTDEGLFRPYSICDIKIQILYRKYQ